MNSVTIQAYLECSRPPHAAKTIACLVGAVIIIVLAVIGFAIGVYVSALTLLLAYWLARTAKASAQSTELRLIQATVEASGNAISVYLPGSRLFDGRYVDQEYTCALGDVESFGFDDAGVFSLRARRLLSDAYENGRQVDHREHEFMEVSFKVVSAEDTARLQEFVRELLETAG